MSRQFIKNLGKCALVLVLILTTAFAALLIVKGFDGVDVASASSTDEIFYGGGDLFYDDQIDSGTSKSETFSYSTKTKETYLAYTSFPDYDNFNGSLDNCCANIAGANLIGYFTKDYSDLIPNCKVGTDNGNGFEFNSMATDLVKKQAVINDLYIKMNTNSAGAGTTQSQYKNGLEAYVTGKGHKIFFTSLMSNSKLDTNRVIEQLKSHNPISLFMSNFGITNIYEEGNQISVYTSLRDANHIAIAYGYEEVKYYDSNGVNVRTLRYLKISTGLSSVKGVYLLNDYGTLNDAEAAYIS